MTDEAKRIERCMKCPLCELQYIDNSRRMHLCLARKGYPCELIINCDLTVIRNMEDISMNGFYTKTKTVEEFDLSKFQPFTVYKVTFLKDCFGTDEHTYERNIPAGEKMICLLDALDKDDPTWLGFKTVDNVYELSFEIKINQISDFKIEQMKTLAEWKSDQSIPRTTGESLDD